MKNLITAIFAISIFSLQTMAADVTLPLECKAASGEKITIDRSRGEFLVSLTYANGNPGMAMTGTGSVTSEGVNISVIVLSGGDMMNPSEESLETLAIGPLSAVSAWGKLYNCVQ